MVYSPTDLAERWNVHSVTVYRLLEAGRLKGFKVGSKWRVNEKQLEEYEEMINDPLYQPIYPSEILLKG